MNKLLLIGGIIALVVWNAYREPAKSSYLLPSAGKSVRFAVRVNLPDGQSLYGGATVSNEGFTKIGETEYQQFTISYGGIAGMKKNTSFSRQAKDGIHTRSNTNVSTPEYLELPLPPQVGRKWSCEIDGRNMDREIVAIESLVTPGKKYENCVKVMSRGAIDGKATETMSYYAPGVGLVKAAILVPGARVEMTLQDVPAASDKN
jgi:hypothetical protein